MLNKYFAPSYYLHKIFNSNTIKVSYCCTQNLGNIIKFWNKKLISSNNLILQWNCWKKEYQLDGKCRANDSVYRWIASATAFHNKTYLGIAQGKFKKWFYYHNMSFKNQSKRNKPTLVKYIWDLKLKENVMPTLKWQI